MAQSIARALLNVVVAGVNLKRAQRRQRKNPCPPHEYQDGILFCLKCGEYRTDLRNVR